MPVIFPNKEDITFALPWKPRGGGVSSEFAGKLTQNKNRLGSKRGEAEDTCHPLSDTWRQSLVREAPVPRNHRAQSWFRHESERSRAVKPLRFPPF